MRSAAWHKRGMWVEPLFGEAKEFHRLRRFRLRGLKKVNIERMMIAVGQNLKRLIKHRLDGICSLVYELLFLLISIGEITNDDQTEYESRLLRALC